MNGLEYLPAAALIPNPLSWHSEMEQLAAARLLDVAGGKEAFIGVGSPRFKSDILSIILIPFSSAKPIP